MQDKTLRDFLDAIAAADRRKAEDLIARYSEEAGLQATLTLILEPALVEVGERWNNDPKFTLAHGYVAAKLVETFLEKQKSQFGSRIPGAPIQGTVVLGNIEDDYHCIGRRLIATFLELAGWRVEDLGNDVPAKLFVDRALETGASVIGASAMMYTTALNIKKLREEIDARGLRGKLSLAVGGAVFNLRPELVETVGGDGTARNALQVPSLIERLSKGQP